MHKVFSLGIPCFLLLLSIHAEAQKFSAAPGWKNTFEYILPEIENRVNSNSNMQITELQLCQKYYSTEMLQEKVNILRTVQEGSINNSNAELFIQSEVNKILGWYKKFKQMNSVTNPNFYKNYSPPNILTYDTIRPDPGPAQGPCSNLGFEDGTMNHWMACGAEALAISANAMYSGSPAVPWGFTGYKWPKWGPMKADCYGTNGNYKVAADCYGLLAAVPTPPYINSYQLRVFNAGDNDSLDPTMPAVFPGMQHSVMVGDYCGVGMGAAILEQKFQVTKSNAAFTYMYALMLENPSGHGYSCQPTFQVNFLDQNGDTIPGCGSYFVVAGPNYPGWKKISEINYLHSWADSAYEKPWACTFISLKKYIGQNVTIQFISRDCCQGAHFGYGYVSAKCDSLTITQSSTGNCQSQSAILTAPQSCGIASYQWSGPCISGPTNTASVTVTCSGIYQVILTPAAGGCPDTLIDTVNLAAVAGIQGAFTYSGKCGSMNFSGSSNSQNTTYNWNFPGGNPSSSNLQNPTNIIYSPGTYTATLIVSTASGCSDTVKQIFTITNSLIAAFTSSAPCLGSSTTLLNGSVSSQTDPITSWSWSIPGGNPSSSSSQNAVVNYATGGSHNVTLIVISQSGCIDTITQQVLVYNPPVATISGSGSGCAPLCISNWQNNSSSTDGNIVSWAWSFPGGNPSSSSLQNPGTVCYNSAGTYGASLIVTTNYGCKDTAKISPSIIATVSPTADFCVSNLQMPASDPVFSFCDLWSPNPGVTNWMWSFGDGTYENNSINPIHNYSVSSTQNDFYQFNVCLKVSMQQGCWDSICKIVEVVPEFEFYIPNAFTPNEDFNNETFFGKSRGVKDYNIWIYDRWGNLIWDCHRTGKNSDWDAAHEDGLSSACKWNGKVQGGHYLLKEKDGSEQVQEDVYVWKVELTDIFNKDHKYIGHVSVIK